MENLNRRIETKTTTLAEDYEIERELLKQLPPERFEVSEISAPLVDQKSRVKVKTPPFGPRELEPLFEGKRNETRVDRRTGRSSR